jgi:hypothetical protein
VQVQLQALLTYAVYGIKQPLPGERHLSTPWTGGWVDFTIRLDPMANRQKARRRYTLFSPFQVRIPTEMPLPPNIEISLK